MGHLSCSTIVYAGTARSQRSGGRTSDLTIELVVDPGAGRVVSVSTNLGLSSLDQLLWEVLVGAPIGQRAESALLEVEVRYCSPLTSAVCKALSNAFRRAQQDAARRDEPGPEMSLSGVGALAG